MIVTTRLRCGRIPSIGMTVGLLALGAAIALAAPAAAAEETIVEAGSATSYLANHADPGIGMTWVERTFDDATWTPGIFGIGFETESGAENLILTPLAPGASSVYTRTPFHLADAGDVHSLFLGADYDDGIVAWINGVEVFRSQEMKGKSLAWSTGSRSHESSNGTAPDYGIMRDISVAALPALRSGQNVLAIGLWNTGSSSSDLVLVPRLISNRGLRRGPYLQLGGPDSVTVRWRTDTPTDSRIRYGPAPGDLTSSVVDGASATDHEISIEGLEPNTRYYYAIGSTTADLAGDDEEHFFVTHPTAGQPKPTRIWVVGDSGFGNHDQVDVRDAYLDFTADRHTDLFLHLGDVSQSQGTDEQYSFEFFEMYSDLLRRTTVWPTFGNHDAASSHSPGTSGPYYEIFTLPTHGEVGGLASGTEAYYSFDYANVHFIVLNSQDIDRSLGSVMLTWLQLDLVTTEREWIVAYWHHPPYSKGYHDSDNPFDSNGRLRDMRENVLPILEDHGVDLVLSGHSHSYERSFFIHGHYDTSDTFVQSMKVDAGDGDPGGDGPYVKPEGALDGTVYGVSGTGAALFPGSAEALGGPAGGASHAAMVRSLYSLGSLVLDIDGNRLDLRFLDPDGVTRDHCTIFHGAVTQPPLADFVGAPLTVQLSEPVSFTDLTAHLPTLWQWDFDDDGTVDSTVPHPTHLYDTPGWHSVRLSVSNSAGADERLRTDYVCVADGLPGEVTGLTLDRDGTIRWEADPRSSGYDLLKGDLLQLRADGDLAGSQQDCLSSGVDAQVVDTALPVSGEGFYYLARGVSCVPQAGSFDTSGGAQAGPRDRVLQGQGAACACPPGDDVDGDGFCDGTEG